MGSRCFGESQSQNFGYRSPLECASCLDILVAKRKITENDAYEGKLILQEIFSMLVGLIKSNSNRVYEEKVEYKSRKS